MSLFIRNAFFPVHELLKGHSTLRLYKEFDKAQWLGKDKLKELQDLKLTSLLEHVKRHVPYYRDIINEQLTLENIPFLTKKHIRSNCEAMRSETVGSLTRSNTGGSTGEPLIFYLGKRRISADIAAKLRATKWWGVDIGDREAVIWGSPVELTKQDRVRQIRDWIFRTRLLSAFDMTEEKMTEYLNFLKKFKPLHMFGYPSSISMLSKHALKKGIRLDNIGVKVVFCTAEKLYDHQRELISETFSAPVANGYGGRDAGFIAHECDQGNMHVADDNVKVEIIDNKESILPSGKRGEIVVTHLESHDFPFIRYRTGDVGILSDKNCSCGRGLGVLKSIEGRSTDFIITPGKKIIHGLALIYVVRDVEGIKEFKIVQDDYDSITLYLSVNKDFNKTIEADIKEGFRKRLGDDVSVEIMYVDKVAPEKSGKYRYVESKVTI